MERVPAEGRGENERMTSMLKNSLYLIYLLDLLDISQRKHIDKSTTLQIKQRQNERMRE